MEVGTEISQKIRSAIKAKLMEYGAYVDDELPDYIMVMVANKRSRLQMNNDLGLFLGDNTSTFTAWLHTLLGKLQTIKSDTDKSADKQGKAKTKGKKKNEKHSGDSVAKRKASSSGSDRKSEGPGETTQDSGKNTFDSLAEKGQHTITKSKNVQDVEDMRQLLVAEAPGDAIADELETTETEVVNSRTITITKRSPSQEQHVQSSAVVRKRKASTSVLADVSKEGEEAYDPVTVKVTTCKSSLPSLQANRQTDSDASEERAHGSQAELQEQYGQPPQKLMKLSDTVHLEDIKQALAEIIEKSQVQNDDIAHFSRMMESSLRKLRTQDLSLAKLRIQQVLCEFESVAAQDDVTEVKHKESVSEEVSYPSQGSKSTHVDTYLGSVATASALENTNSLRISVSGHRHSTSKSSPAQNDNQNSENQTKKSALSDKHYNNMSSSQQKMSSGGTENHVDVKHGCSSSESRSNSESSESHIERVIFHPRSTVESSKSSVTSKVTECHSKTHGSQVKSGERNSTLVKSHVDQSPQSPVSLSKAEMGSPSSVHSCPLSNTSGLIVRRCVTSASRESTVSPTDIQSKPGASLVQKSKPVSSTNKVSTSILVDSIHNRKRLESSETASVLRQSFNRDKSPRATDPSKHDEQDSPRQYGPEALKVMAKNLRITVTNKRAVMSQQESSSGDSDDDDDFESSDDDDDDEDEEENSDSKDKPKDEEAQNKAISSHPTS